jgi:ribonuclease HII
MFNIEQFIDKIIPPSDYQHRNGFSNTSLIDQLNVNEKKLIEDALINKLLTNKTDTLIVETLSYLKSERALPELYNFLKNCSDAMSKIVTAASIFEINADINMIDLSVSSLKELEENKAYYMYTLPTAFYYLAKFNDSKLNSIIGGYINHKEYLISYNAKRHFKNNV